MRQIGHDGRLFKSASDPVAEPSMAQRLSSEERARVEAMTAAGVGVEETARRLGRHRSTVYRELARNCGRGGYDAQAAQTAADRRVRRPKTPVLTADPVLAAAALSRRRDRRSPHAASAELRAEGLSVSAETIYRACYDPTGRRGLPEGCCQGAAGSASPEAATRESPARWAISGPVGAHNSVVGADQGLRAPSWDQESVRDSVHEDSASAPIAAGQRPRQSFRHP